MAESTDESKISRRGALFKLAGASAAVGTITLGLGYEALRHKDSTETVIDFSTDKADYRFLGGAHGNGRLNENINVVTPLAKELIPDDSTFFELEVGDFDYLAPDVYPDLDVLYTRGKDIKPFAFAKDVLSELTQRELPLFLTDVPVPRLDPAQLELIGGLAVSTAIGLGSIKDTNTTRRGLLRVGAAVGLGLLTARPIAGEVMGYLHSVANEPWAQRIALANHAVELAYPESLLTTFRNAVIAVKTLGLEDSFPRNPDAPRSKGLLIYGSGHWGLPEYLKTGQQPILDYLSLYPRSFVETVFGKDDPHLYTSAVITPKDGEIITEKRENPGLKSLFSK